MSKKTGRTEMSKKTGRTDMSKITVNTLAELQNVIGKPQKPTQRESFMKRFGIREAYWTRNSDDTHELERLLAEKGHLLSVSEIYNFVMGDDERRKAILNNAD